MISPLSINSINSFGLSLPSVSSFCRFKSMLRQTEVKALKEVLAIPRVPPNQYALFFQERYNSLRSSNPQTPITEMARQISQQWKSLSSQSRAPYQSHSQIERQKYSQERQDFDSQLTPGHRLLLSLLRHNRSIPESYTGETIKKVKNSLKDFRKRFPRAPLTGKGMFLSEKLAGKRIEEGAGAAAFNAWRNASQEERNLYERKAKEQYEAYKAEIKAFLHSSPSIPPTSSTPRIPQ